MKPLFWVGSSKRDLDKLPDDIKSSFGHALYLAQHGERYLRSKIMKGFGGAGIIEIIERGASGTFRAIYTIKMAKAVFVLHVFQKKSKSGIATPKKEIDLIKRRLKDAQKMYRDTYEKED